MKFPSIKSLAESVKSTLMRFPFEIAFALAGTIAATISLNRATYFDPFAGPYLRIMMTANLGLLLSLSATLFAESRNLKTSSTVILKIIVFIAAACLFFALNPLLRSYDYLRFFMLSLGFHLLVAFAAFTAKGHIHGFWQFNKTLFLRFLTSALYSGVLFLGLAAAIEATKFLFGIKLWNNTYGIMWFWIIGIFNTLFFLAGVPADTRSLDEDISYPKGLKIFTQYVLIPLATVYVAILLAYEIKILIEWRLPKGLVSNLILGYSVFGILSILLVYPVREQAGNKWIKIYARSFYFLLIPLVILLFLAIWSRVIPYGVTVPRYYLIALAFWLFCITIYFLLSKKQNIKLIPVSLCILTLLSIYGPLSSFNVSKYSQTRIFLNIFKKYGAFKDGKLVPLNKFKVKDEDGKNAQEELYYLVNNDGLSSIQPYVIKDLDFVSDSLNRVKDINNKDLYKYSSYLSEYELKRRKTDWAEKYLGLDKFSNNLSDQITYQIKVKNTRLLDVKDYDYVFNYTDDGERDTTTLATGRIKSVSIADLNQVYVLALNNEKISFNLKTIADSLIKNEQKLAKYKDPDYETDNFRVFKLPEALSMSRQTEHYGVTFQMHDFTFKIEDDKKLTILGVAGYYLIKVK
ncbi:MAG TPA: DUF4153 domain-containing protein [Mucilaginibacter sp.]|nr:DUF4153 domain-containing protein [Mucilaginibacter sp.]